MGLKTTRKILSILLVVMMAISSICFLSSITLQATFASKGFYEKYLVNSKVVEECEDQLNKKFSALEAESGIPSRVFEMSMSEYKTEDSIKLAVSHIFNEENASLYSAERVEYFYDLCTEYLDGNKINYKKSEVKSVAKKAAEIYSDTVGIHGVDSIPIQITLFARDCTKTASISIVVIIASIGLLTIIYRKKNYIVMYFACGLAGGGFAACLGSLLSLIFRIGAKVSISPEVYQNSVAGMFRTYFGYLFLAGFVFMLVGSLINFLLIKFLKREEDRQATRFSKIVAKL